MSRVGKSMGKGVGGQKKRRGQGRGSRGKPYGPGALACFLGAMLGGLAGCAVGPNFQRPQVPVPPCWIDRPAQEILQPLTQKEQELARWWEIFEDPLLSSLVERAMASNLDLKLAESRIRQARAARAAAAGSMGPKVQGSASLRQSRTPVTVSSGPGGGETTKGVILDHYEAGFDAGWELDLFGGIRRGLEAAQADLIATVENRRDVLVSLAAEVAREYLELRTLQERIRVARKNLEAQKRTAELTQRRFEGGFASGLDVANAQAQAATTEAQIPLLQSSERQSIYRLSLLLGNEPGALLDELSAPGELPEAPPSVPVGLPSELLRRRPDIRKAEAELHAATARVGVATAELFPKLTLTGSLSFQASELSSWFKWVNRIWSFGPGVSWRLFETGRIRAEIAQRESIQEQAFISYKQAVLAALKEVEDALVAMAREQEHRKALMEALEANRRAVDLALRLYTEGQTDFLNVLQAQRSLYAVEDELIQSLRSSCIQLVALYKALGGGWEQEEGSGPPQGLSEESRPSPTAR